MIVAWLALAFAGTLQEVHQLEWERAPTADLAAHAPDEDPAVRAAVARALGRLHREEAAVPLSAMRLDPDPTVRIAVAEGLGGTPGSAPALREWLADLPAPQRLSERAASDPSDRTRAIEALGRQGDATDIPLLSELLSEPWPTSVSAAEALGRLGRRGIEGAEAGLPALIDALGRPDPRTVTAAAYGIGRIGLAEAGAREVERVSEARVSDPVGRAWLVKAVLPHLGDEARTDAFLAALTDPSPQVRVAALDAIDPDQVPVEIVAPWLSSADAWVRQAAIGALGRLGEREPLLALAETSDDPYEVAFAIGSLGDPLDRDWTDDALPTPVRAAALGASDLEPEALIAVALDADRAPALRTAAVAALMEREEPDPRWADRLLGSSDAVVREAALEFAADLPPRDRVALLLPWIRVESDLELVGTGLGQIADAIEAEPRVVQADDAHLGSALKRAGASRTARVRLAAERVATLLDLPSPTPERGEGTRELVLPDGTVVEVQAGAPVVRDVHRIRGARIETSAGDITLALDPFVAPMAVANFAKLAESDFFDGVVFHRVVPGFVIQTGCPRNDGWGGPGWTIPDELSLDPYTTGSLGMARSSPWDTGGSQWFITTGPTPHLEGDYTRFGQVVQGLDVARRIGRGDTVVDVVIERIPAPE